MGTSTVPASPCTRHRPSVGLVGARRWPSTGCSRLGWASPGGSPSFTLVPISPVQQMTFVAGGTNLELSWGSIDADRRLWLSSSRPMDGGGIEWTGHNLGVTYLPGTRYTVGWTIDLNTDRNALNPKGTVFLLAVLPQFIDAGRPLLAQYLTIAATFGVVECLVMSGYVALAARVLGTLRSPRHICWMNRGFGSPASPRRLPKRWKGSRMRPARNWCPASLRPCRIASTSLAGLTLKPRDEMCKAFRPKSAVRAPIRQPALFSYPSSPLQRRHATDTHSA
jgi:hypothetical protein